MVEWTPPLLAQDKTSTITQPSYIRGFGKSSTASRLGLNELESQKTINDLDNPMEQTRSELHNLKPKLERAKNKMMMI